jgi:Set1/Ash2 histone methyltransferase complex subunit ASH2
MFKGGFRTARATHGVHTGCYYWECIIMPNGDTNAHYRIGWSTRFGELQAPVGYDKYSFGYRDIQGSKIHNSIRIDNYGDSYHIGDVIGCYIYLDDVIPKNNIMKFYKNGNDQGIAFKGNEIPTGIYFPSISVYMKVCMHCTLHITHYIVYTLYTILY